MNVKRRATFPKVNKGRDVAARDDTKDEETSPLARDSEEEEEEEEEEEGEGEKEEEEEEEVEGPP